MVYIMLSFKLKVMRYEYDAINFSLMRHNINAYPREENNCGDDSIMFLTYYRHVCDTFITDKI